MKKLLSILCITVLSLTGASSFGTIIIQDTFTVGSTLGLNGRTTEVGGAAWTASTLMRIEASQDRVDFSSVGTGGARYGASVPFVASGYAGQVVKVSQTQTGTWNEWVGVGFSTSGTSTDYIGSGAPWVRLAAGQLYAYASGLGGTFINGVNIGSGEHDLAVELDLSTKTVTVYVDDVARPETHTYATLPDIQGAGFHMHGAQTPGGNYVDNFQVEVIPEPAVVSMALLGALGLAVRRFWR